MQTRFPGNGAADIGTHASGLPFGFHVRHVLSWGRYVTRRGNQHFDTEQHMARTGNLGGKTRPRICCLHPQACERAHRKALEKSVVEVSSPAGVRGSAAVLEPDHLLEIAGDNRAGRIQPLVRRPRRGHHVGRPKLQSRTKSKEPVVAGRLTSETVHISAPASRRRSIGAHQ